MSWAHEEVTNRESLPGGAPSMSAKCVDQSADFRSVRFVNVSLWTSAEFFIAERVAKRMRILIIQDVAPSFEAAIQTCRLAAKFAATPFDTFRGRQYIQSLRRRTLSPPTVGTEMVRVAGGSIE